MQKKLIFALLATLPMLAHAAQKLPVVASFSILGDVVQQIGGDRVEVRTLVGPDQDAHVFQPRPQDVKTLAAARLFVVNGLGFEGWMPRMSKATGYKGTTLVASEGIKPLKSEEDEKEHDHDHAGHDHGNFDPHVWNNPQNVRVWTRNIAASLSKLDPEGRGYYAQRAAAYDKQLADLDRWAAQTFGQLPVTKRKVITGHDAFGYLARRYQITFHAPQGLSTESEASAKQVAGLIRQIKASGIKAVFVENISDRRLVDQIARESGASVDGKLYSDALSRDAAARSYTSLFRHNVEQLSAGMKKN